MTTQIGGKHQETEGDGDLIMDSVVNRFTLIEYTEEARKSVEFQNLKKEVYHSDGKQIVISLREPPKAERIKEIIDGSSDLIQKLEDYYSIGRLTIVCIDNKRELTFGF